jgi:4-amino-4-deoxy-L-arabinose transferase-like glycosyltransferase
MRPQPSSLGFAEGPFFGLPAGPISRIARFSLWIAVSWVAVFWRLAYMPLLDPDEAHYVEITREMRRLGDYLVPRIDGVPIIDKPALFHWIQAGSMALFGENELAARLPTAIAAIALLGITYWLGKRLFGAATGERAALMLVLTPLTFALARFGYFDMIFTAFLFGGIALLIVSAMENRRALQIPAFILLSLAAQIKGPVAFILVPAAAALACVSKSTRVYVMRIAWIPGLVGAGVLSLPWFLLMWRRFGDSFIEGYVFYNNLQLFAVPLYRKRFDPFFYFRSGAASLFPWSLMLAGAAIGAVRRRIRGETMSPRRVVLWAWVVTIFVFFSASRFKLDHYIFPLVPAMALLVADAWQRASASKTRAWWPIVGTMLAIYVAAVLIGLPYLNSSRPGARLGVWLSGQLRPDDHVIIYNQGRWKASFRYYADHPVQQTNLSSELIEAWRLPKRVYGVMLEKDVQILRDAGLPVRLVNMQSAVIGNSGRLIREQIWGVVVIATNAPDKITAGRPGGP